MVRRLAPFALMAVATAGGCAASRVGHAPPPGAMANRQLQAVSPKVAEIVAQHNQNAELVTSLQASPSVSAKSRISGGARGDMVFERPHNFRFIVQAGISSQKQADIGSNEDEFWFWANDKKDPNVYVSRYDAATSPTSSELTFQPDWIIEALGLREIPEAEMKQIEVSSVKNRPDAMAWTHKRTTLRGEAVKKITILDRTSGQILEHQFYMPGMKNPVAVAIPTGSLATKLADDPERSVRVPQKIHLRLAPADAKQSPIEMDLVLNGLKVNAAIAQARRDELFAIPQMANNPITRLDEPAEKPAPRARPGDLKTETRQSPAPPEAGSGVELGEPAPIGVDGAFLRRSDAMPLSPDLGGNAPEGPDKVVGVPTPTAPETPADRVAREPMVLPR